MLKDTEEAASSDEGPHTKVEVKNHRSVEPRKRW